MRCIGQDRDTPGHDTAHNLNKHEDQAEGSGIQQLLPLLVRLLFFLGHREGNRGFEGKTQALARLCQN
jgi:hypothetical protein